MSVQAEQAAREVAPWIEALARLGYAAKGVAYILVGILAVRAAQGAGGETTGLEGAFRTILRQPFGEILLYVVALGLLGYALWRIIEGLTDPAGLGADPKGIARRLFRIGRGVFHAFLAWGAFKLARGTGGGSSQDQEAESLTAQVMEMPFGVWLVGAGGVILAGYGIAQLVRAWKAKLDKQLALGSIEPGRRRWLVLVSRYGLAARGVVFAILGGFLIAAAIQHDPTEAGSTGEALTAIGGAGAWVLVLVALGLASYGVYELVKARYRRIDVA